MNSVNSIPRSESRDNSGTHNHLEKISTNLIQNFTELRKLDGSDCNMVGKDRDSQIFFLNSELEDDVKFNFQRFLRVY